MPVQPRLLHIAEACAIAIGRVPAVEVHRRVVFRPLDGSDADGARVEAVTRVAGLGESFEGRNDVVVAGRRIATEIRAAAAPDRPAAAFRRAWIEEADGTCSPDPALWAPVPYEQALLDASLPTMMGMITDLVAAASEPRRSPVLLPDLMRDGTRWHRIRTDGRMDVRLAEQAGTGAVRYLYTIDAREPARLTVHGRSVVGDVTIDIETRFAPVASFAARRPPPWEMAPVGAMDAE